MYMMMWVGSKLPSMGSDSRNSFYVTAFVLLRATFNIFALITDFSCLESPASSNFHHCSYP
jgi:hypothetical protein